MTVLVDAAAGVVAEGAVRWPLRLDCRTGTAVLTIGNRDLAVAPLRWRDKQRLARWAHLGQAFVAAQRIELAVPPGTVLDDETRPLVAAVADFLDGDALPLSPDLLSEVAVAVCRLTGLAPAAFDDRDAIDVESAWRSNTPEQPTHSPAEPSVDHGVGGDPWADATRIVITPDPPHVDVPPRITAPVPPAHADDPRPEQPDPPQVDNPTPDRAPAPPGADATPSRAHPPQLRAHTERRRAAQPYRIAPVQAPPRPAPPDTDHPRGHVDSPAVVPADGPPITHPAPGPSTTMVPRLGGPLVAPVATPPDPRASDAAAGQPDASARAAGAGDTDDQEGLEALTAAVADRLAEQLARASHDLGIEV